VTRPVTRLPPQLERTKEASSDGGAVETDVAARTQEVSWSSHCGTDCCEGATKGQTVAGKWGCVQARELWSTKEQITCVLDTTACSSLETFLEACAA
jgi:hypothetical protein